MSMDALERERGRKALIAHAVDYGRLHWSEQTQFLHYHRHSWEDETHDTIPIIENALFALALLRSKTVEQIVEGQALLKRLLPFQSPDGLFPLFLHQYPVCHDAFIGRRLLAIFHFVQRDFGHVLDSELTSQLAAALEALAEHSLRILQDRTVPPHVSIPCATGLYCLGGEWPARIADLLGALWESVPDEALGESGHLAELALALTWKGGPEWSDRMDQIWTRFSETYDTQRKIYKGPCAYELHYDSGPLPGLYGLLQAYIHGDLATSHCQPGGYQLLAALFDACPEARSAKKVLSGLVGGNRWESCSTADYSFSLLERLEVPSESKHPGFHLARLHWMEHSLSIQTDRQYKSSFERRDGGFRLSIEVDVDSACETRTRAVPVGIYLDTVAKPRLLLAGKASTVFDLGANVEVQAQGMRLQMQCTSSNKEARFLGHVQRGNRPAQRHRTGNARFEAYDTCFLLRTVQQEGPTILYIDLDITNEVSPA